MSFISKNSYLYSSFLIKHSVSVTTGLVGALYIFIFLHLSILLLYINILYYKNSILPEFSDLPAYINRSLHPLWSPHNQLYTFIYIPPDIHLFTNPSPSSYVCYALFYADLFPRPSFLLQFLISAKH